MRVQIPNTKNFFFVGERKRIRNKNKYLNHMIKKETSWSNWFDGFMDLFDIIILYINITWIFLSRTRRKLLIRFSGGSLHLSQWAIYRIVAIDVRSRREGRALRKVGFYDPIKNQTYLNVPVILYFLEKGAQPTGTVHDISKKAGVFMELRLNHQTKFN